MAHHDHISEGWHTGIVSHLGSGDVESPDVCALHLFRNQGRIDIDLSAWHNGVHVLLEGRQVHNNEHIGFCNDRRPNGVIR